MAKWQQQTLLIEAGLFFYLVWFIICVKCQNYGEEFYRPSYDYNNFNSYNVPNPGDRDYRTYVYNNRRYGQYQPNGYDGRYPGDPNLIGQDVRFRYDQVNVKLLLTHLEKYLYYARYLNTSSLFPLNYIKINNVKLIKNLKLLITIS